MRSFLAVCGVCTLMVMTGVIRADDEPRKKAIQIDPGDLLSVIKDRSLKNLQRLTDKYDEELIEIEGRAVAIKKYSATVVVTIPFGQRTKKVLVAVRTDANPLKYHNRVVRFEGFGRVDVRNGLWIDSARVVEVIRDGMKK